MTRLISLRIVRTIVNAIVGEDKPEETKRESELRHIAAKIQRILDAANINEN